MVAVYYNCKVAHMVAGIDTTHSVPDSIHRPSLSTPWRGSRFNWLGCNTCFGQKVVVDATGAKHE